MTDEQAEATSFWNQRYEEGKEVGSQPTFTHDPTDYTQHTFLYQRSIAKPQTGSLDGFNLDRVGRKFLTPPPARTLALGSGMAFSEEYLLRNNYAQTIVAYEVSTTAVEKARARFAEAGLSDRIEMHTTDVLVDNLPSASFDAVFVQAAIHHFERIEDMFALMHRVLKPGGLLVYDEYVGPDHHMYHPDVLAVMDEINDCLAPAYRWDCIRKETRVEVPRPSLEWIMAYDPSEGVHASRILPLTYQYFDVVDRADCGGAVMRGFFTGILPNFDFESPKDQTIASLIVLIERLLTQHSIIPNYQTGIVARRRDTPRPGLSEADIARIGYNNWPGLRQTEQARIPPGTSLLDGIKAAMHALRSFGR